MKGKNNVEILSGWRLELFNHLIDSGLMKIKKDKEGNNRLIATNKFMKLVDKKMKKRK
jgi:hypothetical protein